MIIQPHLPAPTAVPDPFSGHAARGARTAAQRFGVYDPLSANGNNRLRRDLARAETGDTGERVRDPLGLEARYYPETAEILGRSATSLFFAQRFAQEEDPDRRPSVAHEAGAAAYPSLAFDDDILLPGQAVPLGWAGEPRLDILV